MSTVAFLNSFQVTSHAENAGEFAGRTGPDLTAYALVCFGLFGAIVLLAYLFRRFLADGLKRRAAQRSLQILDVLPLGGRQKLAVVRCYDRSFLLGIGDKEVRSIAELDAATLTEAAPKPAAERPFTRELVRAIEAAVPKRRKSQASAPSTDSAGVPIVATRSAKRSVSPDHPPEPASTTRFPRGRGLLG